MVQVLWIFAVAALLFLNAFFVAAEFGMVRLRETRIQLIENEYGFRGYILKKIHKHLDAYLSACQLGITLASLGLGWIGEPVFAYLLEPVFGLLNITSTELTRVIAFLAGFILLSFLHIVIGELMPKSLAIRRPEGISVWTAIPLYGFYWAMYPAIFVLNSVSNFLLKKTGLDRSNDLEHFYTSEEIKIILNASHLHGELTEEETKIIEHIMDFADLQVTEVIRPSEEMVMLDTAKDTQELLKIAVANRYSRYPVYDSVKREIIGIVHIKDLFEALYNTGNVPSIEKLVRPILKVNYRLPALELLGRFREGMPHFALVYKGKTNLLGFVTLDNLLHVFVGRIKDEFHKTRDDWAKNADGSLTVLGGCSIYSLENALNTEITLFDDEEDIDTISGLIIARLGAIPEEKEQVEFDEFYALIEKVEGSSIRKITVYPRSSTA